VAFFTLIARSYLKARNKTPVHKGLSIPFVALLLVILVGIYQAVFPAQVNQSVILTHVLFGGFAFWGGLVLVFSYKLVPMFAISHGYKASLSRSATPYFTGVVLLIASFWFQSEVVQTIVGDVASSLMLLSLLSYTIDVISIVRARKGRRLVLPLYDSFLATLFFVFGQIGVILSVVFHSPVWLYPAIYLFSFGGLMALMFSYMQKMVPFLWFEYRFSKRLERKTAPLIDDMVPKRTAQLGMIVYFVGVMTGFTGFFLGGLQDSLMILDWGSAICLTSGSILLFVALRHVLTIGGTRPPDEVT